MPSEALRSVDSGSLILLYLLSFTSQAKFADILLSSFRPFQNPRSLIVQKNLAVVFVADLLVLTVSLFNLKLHSV